MTSLSCPLCTAPLTDDVHEGVACSSCASGHGMFLSYDSLREMVARREADQALEAEDYAMRSGATINLEAPDGAPRACPQCGKEMQRINYAYESGVLVDTCSEHGLWLDAGELERIEAWVEGNERLVTQEAVAWHGKLNEIEREQDATMAAASGSGHWGPVGWVAANVSAWNLGRNDQN